MGRAAHRHRHKLQVIINQSITSDTIHAMISSKMISTTVTEDINHQLNSADQNCDDEEENSQNWEVLSDSEKDVPTTEQVVRLVEIDALHRCVSSPNLSMRNVLHTDEFSDVDSYLDVRSLQTEGTKKGSSDDWSMISSTTGTFKKSPSFKDMLLMNADSKQDQARKELQEKLRQNVVERKTITPTFVVSKVHTSRLKRCGFSTGDLQDAHYTLDKRELPTQESTIPEEEVVGDSDAMEFYSQKAMGSTSRAKGLKLRPDEAKRKEYSLYKKEIHRNSQHA